MMILPKHPRCISILILAGLTAGCAGDATEQLFVQPGRFDYLSCAELVSERQKSVEREQELKTLIERAEKEPAGAILAVASYRGEYLQVQGEQKMQAQVMARKNCAPDTPPSPAVIPSRSVKRR